MRIHVYQRFRTLKEAILLRIQIYQRFRTGMRPFPTIQVYQRYRTGWRPYS